MFNMHTVNSSTPRIPFFNSRKSLYGDNIPLTLSVPSFLGTFLITNVMKTLIRRYVYDL